MTRVGREGGKCGTRDDRISARPNACVALGSRRDLYVSSQSWLGVFAWGKSFSHPVCRLGSLTCVAVCCSAICPRNPPRSDLPSRHCRSWYESRESAASKRFFNTSRVWITRQDKAAVLCGLYGSHPSSSRSSRNSRGLFRVEDSWSDLDRMIGCHCPNLEHQCET